LQLPGFLASHCTTRICATVTEVVSDFRISAPPSTSSNHDSSRPSQQPSIATETQRNHSQKQYTIVDCTSEAAQISHSAYKTMAFDSSYEPKEGARKPSKISIGSNPGRRLSAPPVYDHSADDILEAVGYTAELNRSRSTLGVTFMSFVLASVPYGLSTTLIYPLLGGGPATVLWGWILVCSLMLCVAISLGEITSVSNDCITAHL
jgi:hypothetical protein